MTIDPFAPLLEQPAADTLELSTMIEGFAGSLPLASAETVPLMRAAAAQQGQPKLDGIATILVPTPHGDVPLRVFRPSTVKGVYLHMHGGGWIGGASDLQDAELQELAEATDLVLLSVEYRLAPEHPFPAPQDDCEAAALWVLENAGSEFGTQTLVLGGCSAGAHLALVTALRLRDRHGYSDIAALDLRSGMYDLRLTPSARLHKGGLLNGAALTAITGLATSPDRLEDPDVSPLLADLQGLPPAILTVGGGESLLDDTLFLYTRWRASGNVAELVLVPGGWHLFDKTHPRIGPEVRARVFAFLREHLQSRAALAGATAASS